LGLAAAIALLTCLAASGLLRLEFDDNHRNFFRGSGDAYEQLEKLAATFPLDENDFIILLEAEDLLRRDRVAALRRLDGALREAGGVLGVYSIFDVRSQQARGLLLPPLMPPDAAPDLAFEAARNCTRISATGRTYRNTTMPTAH
jgi:predicted RND superfamily exporter protein